MTDADDRTIPSPAVEGLPVDEATARALEAEPRLDERTVTDAFSSVAAHGEAGDRLTRDALSGKLAAVESTIATAESDAEDAERELEDAYGAAEEVRDRPVVESRLGRQVTRLNDLQREVNGLRPELHRLRNAEDDLFALVYDTIQLEAGAEDLQERAASLAGELAAFETWLSDPDARFDELDGDLNALEGSLERTETGLDHIASAVEDGDTEPLAVDDTALAWVDATFTHRVLDLLLADLEWEFDALRAWSEEADDDVADRVAELSTRLAEFEAEVETVGDRLADLERDAWTERFADERAAFEADLEGAAPPVEWGVVQATLTEHRERLREE